MATLLLRYNAVRHGGECPIGVTTYRHLFQSIFQIHFTSFISKDLAYWRFIQGNASRPFNSISTGSQFLSLIIAWIKGGLEGILVT